MDYSGKSGVPGLYAVVDRIDGGKRKLWNFQMPRSKDVTVSTDKNTFTLKRGDVSMKATFVAPADVKVEKVTGKWVASPASGIMDVDASLIQATSADGNGGQFFVVFTLQRGDAPAITVDGTGLNAKVKVGEQSLSFDGANLLIGK